ncbi:hypothetical protein BP6252_02997 [Coleophoma cylindrospora]|uniref:Heterokaryon incompatibility domain-containing protein n=1 Tax=Coleophoma cylindrospora TaxID=1849047 RepID=A0A3D8S6E4_9HELO|nr:hypothetical protein BP6252_02997 [Coleophoma cylindrospora]
MPYRNNVREAEPHGSHRRPYPAEAEEYVHKPLLDLRSIRIVKLEPGVYSDPLDISLIEISLDAPEDRQQYCALSYVWGSRRRSQLVKCEGKSYYITKNCHDALRSLRWNDRPLYVWVDCICIDQSSREGSQLEQNNHVKLMGEIYHKAKDVDVWLGEASKDEVSAMRYLEDLGDGPRPYSNAVKQFIARPWQKYNETKKRNKLLSDLRWLNSLSTFPQNYKILIMLAERVSTGSGELPLDFIYNNSWQFRIWTLQEIAMASDCILFYNDSTNVPSFVNWVYIQQGAQLYHNYCYDLEEEEDLEPGFHIIGLRNWLHLFLEPLHKERKSTDDNQILDRYLKLMPNLHASKSIDKIYGFYSVLSTIGITLPDPDYSKSVELVYEELALAVMQKTNSLQNLRLLPTAKNRLSGLPSWVPDWDLNDGMPYLQAAAEFYGRTEKVESPQQGQLQLLGKEVDKIRLRADTVFEASTSPWKVYWGEDTECFPHGTLTEFEEKLRFISILKDWLEFSRELRSYPGNLSVIEAFQMTLLQSSHLTPDENRAMDFVCNMIQYPAYRYEDAIKHATSLARRLERKDEAMDISWTDDVRFRMITLLALEAMEPPSGILSWDVWKEFRPRLTLRFRFNLIRNRAFFITGKGYMGTAPYTIEENDRIVLFQGTTEPMILRPAANTQQFEIIGPAFIPGLIKPYDQEQDNNQDSSVQELITYTLV